MIENTKPVSGWPPTMRRAFWVLFALGAILPGLLLFAAPSVPPPLVVGVQVVALLGLLLVMRRMGALRAGFIAALFLVPLALLLLLRLAS